MDAASGIVQALRREDPAQTPVSGRDAPERAQTAAVPSSAGGQTQADAAPADEIPVPGGEESLAATRPGFSGTADSGQKPVAPAGGEAAAQAGSMVEKWRGAWQSGNVDAYMAFYAPDAVQGPRSGAESIRRHKARLWAATAPKKVVFDDVRVAVKGATATVTMVQEYVDAKGGGDKGLKTLTLERSGNAWRIADETWNAVP